MAAQGQDHSTSEHLPKMIVKGEVRPGKGPRFIPRPIKTQPSDKTAADWVAGTALTQETSFACRGSPSDGLLPAHPRWRRGPVQQFDGVVDPGTSILIKRQDFLNGRTTPPAP